jgi:hypothetical protein
LCNRLVTEIIVQALAFEAKVLNKRQIAQPALIHANPGHPYPDKPYYPLADANRIAEKDMAFISRGN